MSISFQAGRVGEHELDIPVSKIYIFNEFFLNIGFPDLKYLFHGSVYEKQCHLTQRRTHEVNTVRFIFLDTADHGQIRLFSKLVETTKAMVNANAVFGRRSFQFSQFIFVV